MTAHRLDAGAQTLIVAAEGAAMPAIVYWGPRLPDAEDIAEVVAAAASDLAPAMLDGLPPLDLCPTAATGLAGQPGIVVAAGDGSPLGPAFRHADIVAGPGRIEVTATDDALGLTWRGRMEATPDGLFALSAEIEAAVPLRLHWLAAPVLPGPAAGREILDLGGRWTGELQVARTPWQTGARLREARGGRSGQDHFPGAYFPAAGTTDTAGPAWACTYAWSGGHRMVAEELLDGRRQIQFGHAAGSEREPAVRFATATLLAACDTAGLNGCAVRLQRHVRDRLVPWPDRARDRPVHYNCWEAVYFDHDLTTLGEIAERAARLGAERFVLDDGWFGRRDDATSSLGDWIVDRRKWPDGLTPLIERVAALGMSFGLWVEPEMVSPDSDLHRAHPDWTLGPADQPLGRGQLVLDLAQEEVRDHLFDRLDALLRDHAIDYLKWDHNRPLPWPDAAQTRGVYDLIDRLRQAHPAVEIESCASGGGRIDFGILARTHRVWLSDSNDALERLRMQHDAALFLPGCVTGAHVGPRHSHTSGRDLPIGFRAGVAAMRHLGLELDPRELTEGEAAELTRVVGWWRQARAWLTDADIHRLAADDPTVIAEMHRAGDGGRFAVFAGQSATANQAAPRPLRLTALDRGAIYEVALVHGTPPPTSRATPPLARRAMRLSGAWLMAHGLTLPLSWPATLWIVEGRRVTDGAA